MKPPPPPPQLGRTGFPVQAAATQLGPDDQVGTWPEFNKMIGGFFKFHWNDGQEITYNGRPCFLKMFNDVTEQHRSQEELMAAIREVMSDTAWFGQSVVQKLAEIRGGSTASDSEFDLTTRERQILELVAAGLDDEQIADNLGISQKTVRNHLSNTYAKTGVHSRAEAIVWARDRGMVARV